MSIPFNADQWAELKKIKDEIRNNSLNLSHVVIRTYTAGSLISGFDPNIWDDNYNADTYTDVVVSGELWELTGYRYRYVQGGVYKDADAQFLTHVCQYDKFIKANEVWHRFDFTSGGYTPEYISGTNTMYSGECYNILKIEKLPFDFECSVWLKSKKTKD